ncbi:MAG: phosphate/phosphite/phosphonate ABC transporter substrate-binding protein [Desulfobulbaceae bacterium]|uniref:Phosphate/phosphite/phosphonate ABC transporter substrate-binding protein n=1 Tax=Candidatus Desulfatifera sulfidica TaxID=2841691 RepID=A0A8J6TDC9_9BACT|nr:phosphate/phosphite/phosphonate ABC transporter substrate-binding protein [Candidatus Desulfatifera sulfidica]
MLRLIGFLLLIPGLLALSGCDSRSDLPPANTNQKVIDLNDLTQLPPSPPSPRNKIIRVAVAAILSPSGTLDSYSPLLKYLEETFKQPVHLVQRKTYQEINGLLAQGKVDVAFVCTGAYLEGIKKGIMSAIVVPQINGRTTYQSYIISRTDSAIHTFDDLQDKVFAFTDPMSNTGHLYPLSLLDSRTETPSSFFNRTIFTYSHDRSIYAVADGVADGAAVDNLILAHAQQRQPELIKRLKIIQESPEYGIPPVVVPNQLAPEKKKQFEQFFLNIHNQEDGRRALKSLAIQRFVKPDLSLYDF